MGLQAQMTRDDQRLYSTNRDVAHNFKFIAEALAGRLEDGGQWKSLDDYLQLHHVKRDELGDGAVAFINFVCGSCGLPTETMGDVLEASGFLRVREPVQVAVVAHLGALMMGVYFTGVREATMPGYTAPCANVSQLQDAAKAMHRLLFKPWWSRWLGRVKKLFRKNSK